MPPVRPKKKTGFSPLTAKRTSSTICPCHFYTQKAISCFGGFPDYLFRERPQGNRADHASLNAHGTGAVDGAFYDTGSSAEADQHNFCILHQVFLGHRLFFP